MGDNYPVVQFKSSQYVNTTPLPKPKYDAPQQLLRCHVKYKIKEAVDLFQFAQDISDQCHYRVRITPDAEQYLYGGETQGVTGGSTQRMASIPSPVLPAGSMQPLASFGSSSAQSVQQAPATRLRENKLTNLSYEGAVGGLLDQGTARLGISWKVENDAVIFYYLQTVRLDIQPADAQYTLKGEVTSGLSSATGTDSTSSSGTASNSGGTGGAGVSGSGGSTMSSTSRMGNNLYSDLKSTVQSMLTPGVGRMSLNETTGTMMVTDVPETVSRIKDYIDAENKTLSKQVIFKIVVYTVNMDTSDVAGINWNAVWKSLSQNYGLTLANTETGIDSSAISGGFNVLDTASGAASQFAGTSFLLQALSKQANVSDVKTSTIMTTNMSAAPVLVGQQTTYLKEVSTTAYSTGNSTVPTQTLTPGTVTTGTNITIFPKVLDNGRLMLNLFMDISSLKNLRVITSSTDKIEAPDMDTRSIQQRIWLKPGQTFIMSGFEQNTNNSSKQGTGSPNNIIFGGARSGEKTKQSFVITVTPYVR
jgi:type IVB pilus formation R64 PilN family outer membrane protein